MRRKPTVLFVDDDPTTCRIYESRFTRFGLPHYIASSAQVAVEILEENDVDIVVTDLMMPDYDGTELIECLRECPDTRALPIILLTAGGQPAMVAQALSSGATSVMMKPAAAPAKVIDLIYRLTKDPFIPEQSVQRY
jgi:CheY-like chemotaxis protein